MIFWEKFNNSEFTDTCQAILDAMRAQRYAHALVGNYSAQLVKALEQMDTPEQLPEKEKTAEKNIIKIGGKEIEVN